MVISIALYGNPTEPDNVCPGGCTIGQYVHLKQKCDHLVDAYFYQTYANWKNDPDTNFNYIEKIGDKFGWTKLGFGVGVANNPWRWYPDNPGKSGSQILSRMLDSPNGKLLRGVRRYECRTVENFAWHCASYSGID